MLTSQWTTAEAIKWFGLRMVPVNWLILLVELLYLTSQYFKPTELQLFLPHCCWSRPGAATPHGNQSHRQN